MGSGWMVYHAPTPQAGRVTDSDGGGRVRVGGGGYEGRGGRWYHASMLLGSGEVKLVVGLVFERGIQTVTISAVGECAKLKLSTIGECVE